MKPSELVPQLANPALRKRELKIMEKDRKKFKELDQQQYEVSQAFEQNLYQGNDRMEYYAGQITDQNSVIENCNKMARVLQEIEKQK